MTQPLDVYLHHGALSVRDLDRSIEFYSRVLGFEQDSHVSVESQGMEIVHLKRGDDYLELFCLENAADLPAHAEDYRGDFNTIGTKHIAFGSAEPEAAYKTLTEMGVDGLTDFYESDFYKYFFFKDPDGIVLEIVHKKT